LLLNVTDNLLDYAGVSELAHAICDVVVGEIESRLAVLGGKSVSVPAR